VTVVMTSNRNPKGLSSDEQEHIDSRLITAAFRGDAQEVREVLAAGANVHARTDEALCWAARRGCTEMALVLLEAGSNVHARDDYPLNVAGFYGNVETVRALSEHIFAADSWRGRSRAEIERQACALYKKVETFNPSLPIRPYRNLRNVATVLFEGATDCWHQVRPVPKLNISPTPAQPRPL
jgi:hypothetical protein